MIPFLLLIGILILSILFFIKFNKSRPTNFPKGPKRWPIFGNLLSIGSPPHNGVKKIVQEYGDIVGIFCGNYQGILLSDIQLIRDAYKDDRFSARPPLRPFLERSWGSNKGLIFGTGASWAEQRKFIIGVFKEFGFGSRDMENLIQEEIDELIKLFKENEGKEIVISPHIHMGIVNILWNIITGSRFRNGDLTLKKLIEYTENVVKFRSLDGSSFTANILFFMPWLTKLFPNYTGWTHFITSFEKIFPIFRNILNEHRETRDSSHSRDLIDTYLEKIESTTDQSSSFYKIEGERNLLVTILDLFVAGGETASSNITWAILFLISYPQIQEKIHNELDRVVGKDRKPSLADRKEMKYFEAFLFESLRMASIGVMSIFHSTSEYIPDFHGYSLPKDTLVFANVWQVHHNKKTWGDPEIFRPERFLSEEAGRKNLKDHLNVFSTGKRVCPGEGLARDELFLVLTGLLQVFQFKLPDGASKPCLDPALAHTLRKHPQLIVPKLR